MIRKLKSGDYRLYSRKKDPKTGKRRNLGTFSSKEAAEKHEREVQYFKRHYSNALSTSPNNLSSGTLDEKISIDDRSFSASTGPMMAPALTPALKCERTASTEARSRGPNSGCSA